MKRTLLCLTSLFSFFLSHAQRDVDLQVTITSPADNSTVNVNELVTFVVNIQDVDTSDLLASDTVSLYLLLDGDTIVFQPDNVNHFDYSGHLLHPQESFNVTRSMFFSESFDGMSVDVCFYAKPINAANPLTDPEQSNNMSCITVHVGSNNLSLSENQSGLSELFPNPASTQFSVSGISENAEIAVSGVDGGRVGFVRNSDGSIDCSSWKAGVYFVHITDGQNSSTKQLVLVH